MRAKKGDGTDIPLFTYHVLLIWLYVFPRVRIAPVPVQLRCMPAQVLSGRFLPLFLLVVCLSLLPVGRSVPVSASCVPAVRFSDCSLRGGTAAPVIQMVWQAGLRDWRRSWLVVGSWWLGVGPSRRFATCPFGDFAYRSSSFLLLVVWESGRRGCVFIYTWFFCMWERMRGGFEVYWFLDK